MKLIRISLSTHLRWLCLGLALLLSSFARGSETIVDNTGHPDHTGEELSQSGRSAARAFEFAAPASLATETIRLRVRNYNSGGSSSARVKLWSGPGTTPTGLLEDLGTVTFSGSSQEIVSISSTSFPQLIANTRYWVSVHWVSGDFDWLITSDTGNSTSALGTIEGFGVTSNNDGSSWSEITGPTDFHQFEVLGCRTVVTSTDDSGPGTLRDLIAAVPSGGPPVTFDPSLSGNTISLTTTELLIDKDLTIDASALADGITISGDKTSDGRSPDDNRIFRIASGGHTVVMNLLTLRDGYGVDLDGAEVDNEGGAILHPDGDLTLNHCSLAGNFAQLGGAILHAAGSLTLNHTTIAGNETNDTLVSLGFYGGGGIFIAGGTVVLNHSTLSANVTSNNGGGLFLLDGSLTVTDTIVAGNTAGSSGDIFLQGGSLIASGVNLIGDHTTVEAQFPFALPLVGQPGNLAPPLLAPLGDYGGPTQTMPPLPGSPAIDAAASTALPTDQRGAPRTVDGDAVAGAVADIGAVEYQPTVVTTHIDEDGVEPGTGLSLREAIARAHVSTITFDAGLSGQTLTLGASQLTLSRSVIIDASALTDGFTISGNYSSRVMVIYPENTVSVSNLTIMNGFDVDNGGGVSNDGNLTLNRCTLSGNATADLGGGIFNQDTGTLTLNHCTMALNRATGTNSLRGRGGAIYNSRGTLTLNHTTVSGNNAVQGSGIYNDPGTLTLNHSVVAEKFILEPSVLIDNGDPEFSADSNFRNAYLEAYFNGDMHFAPAGNGSSSACWTFTGLSPGQYRVSATWTTHPARASDAPFTIRNGSTVLSATNINQQLSPVGPTIMGSPFQELATVSLTGNTLVVELTDNANGFVSADAVHIEAIEVPSIFGSIDSSVSSLVEGDPMLAPLGDYGGPGQTMPPLPGSPAIDAGGTTALLTDQRGAPRTVDGDAVAGAVVDIGAVEYQPTTVTTRIDEDGVEPGVGLSLREAIARAHVSTITFDPGLSGQTLTLGSSQLTLLQSVIIDASALPDGFTIDAVNEHRVLVVDGGTVVTLDSLTLTGGNSSVGGGIFNRGTLTLNTTTLSNNHTNEGGGGIYNEGTLTVTHSTLSGNSASAGGGMLNFGTLTVTHSTLSGNSAVSDGGGIYSFGTLTLNQSTVSGNSAAAGGGIYNEGTLTVTHSTLSGNSAAFGGGGIVNGDTGILNLTNSIVAVNAALGGPDVLQNSGTTNATGVNLLSDLAGSGLAQGASVLIDDPLLAPLGDYGGPTHTMPPLPGSPAIDTGGTTSPLATDQRGLPRVVDGDTVPGAVADIGAVEIQGPADALDILTPLWFSNTDGDADAFGLEFAFGTDANAADFTSPRRFQIPGMDGNGKPMLTFGMNPAAAPFTSWVVKRSTTLQPGSFTEIYRYHGPTAMETATGTTATLMGNLLKVVDDNPPPGGAFYLFEAEPSATP